LPSSTGFNGRASHRPRRSKSGAQHDGLRWTKESWKGRRGCDVDEARDDGGRKGFELTGAKLCPMMRRAAKLVGGQQQQFSNSAF